MEIETNQQQQQQQQQQPKESMMKESGEYTGNKDLIDVRDNEVIENIRWNSPVISSIAYRGRNHLGNPLGELLGRTRI
jgi:hypothetical protein